jgi:hypothetical protein
VNKKGSFFGNTLKLLLLAVVSYLAVSMLYITFLRADQAVEPVSAFFKTIGFWGIAFIVLIANFFFVGLLNIKKGGPIYALLILDVVVCWIIYGLLF